MMERWQSISDAVQRTKHTHAHCAPHGDDTLHGGMYRKPHCMALLGHVGVSAILPAHGVHHTLVTSGPLEPTEVVHRETGLKWYGLASEGRTGNPPVRANLYLPEETYAFVGGVRGMRSCQWIIDRHGSGARPGLCDRRVGQHPRHSPRGSQPLCVWPKPKGGVWQG